MRRIRPRVRSRSSPERRSIAAGGLALAGVLGVAVLVGSAAAEEKVDFNRDIRPILSQNCFQCHGPDPNTREAGLRLDTREGALADLGDYAAVVPGRPEESELLRRIAAEDADERMPPPDAEGELTPAQIESLRRWIEQGAPYQRHWAFEPIRRAEPPAVRNSAWPRNAVDRFVLAKLQQHGITPSPEADRSTLIRRVYLDLIGFPPAPEEVDAFVSDEAPDAYERLVDRLLSNPHYGERWGRRWLDQARYADSNGYTVDGERTIWPYRDWVIKAFNEDMPFDQFTIEQLAGDLLENPSTDQLVATGFHRNTLINTEGGVKADQFRDEQVKDRVDTTGVVWMGLTVGCAKCHSHKYDPIEQKEYYELYAFFNSTADENSVSPTIGLPAPEQKEKLEEVERQIASLKKEPKLSDSDRGKLNQLESERAQLQKQIPATMVMRELKKPRDTHVHLRGDFLRPGEPVQPDVPDVLPPLACSDPRRTRLDLARWLLSEDHPLTARVYVNRIWMHLFGRGLVETENDFGTQGTPPAHPELLDWLAAEFRSEGWSTRRLLRLLVTSAAYRQSSRARADLKEVDPRNDLLARQSRLRVEAEILRDLSLAAGGLLCEKIGGPSVFPPQPEGVYSFTQVQKKWPTSQGEDRYRRGMYTFFYRSAPYPMLATFDVPNLNQTCTRRDRSNTPLQSLTVANDETMIEAAQALAARIHREINPESLFQKGTGSEPNQVFSPKNGDMARCLSPFGTDSQAGDDARLARAFRLCLARPPEPAELARLRQYLQQERERFGRDEQAATACSGTRFPEGIAPQEAAAWTAVCRVLINLDEFITRE